MKIFFRVLLFIYLATVAFLCFATFDHLPTVKWTFMGFASDKIVHFLMFLPFPVLCFFSLRQRSARFWHSIAISLTIFLIGTAFAGATELIQGCIPSRAADIQDFYADLAAIAIGSLFIFCIDNIYICRHRNA